MFAGSKHVCLFQFPLTVTVTVGLLDMKGITLFHLPPFSSEGMKEPVMQPYSEGVSRNS